MRRMMIFVGVVLLGVALSGMRSEALTDHGELCFQMLPFQDILIVSVLQSAGPHTLFTLPARWDGANVYRLDGSGTANQHVDPNQDFQLGFWFVNHDANFFGGNRVCSGRATLTPSVPGSSVWDLVCTGGAAPFVLDASTVPGIAFALVPCPAVDIAALAEVADGVFVDERGAEIALAGTWRP